MKTWTKLCIIMIAIVYEVFNTHITASPITENELIFLDVGQGDALLLITKDHYSLLVDTGSDISATSAISNYWHEKYLDFVIITHPDNDHLGGIYDIARNFQIKKLLSEPIPGFSGYQHLEVFDGQVLMLGCCVQIKFYNTNSKASDTNSRSIALVITSENNDVFIAGDLPSQIEDSLISKLPDLEILKVGHHGSSTSTSEQFLKNTKPEFAVISVGNKNKYGHPQQQIIERLQNNNIKILRTDQSGDILFDFGANKLQQISTK